MDRWMDGEGSFRVEFEVGECDEGRVLGGEDPGQPVVKCDDGREDTKEARGPFHMVAILVLGNGEEKKCCGEEDKEDGEAGSCPEARHEEHDRENGPSQEEDGYGVGQIFGVRVGGETARNPKPRDEKCGIREPKAAIRGEGSGGKRVAAPKRPHSRDKLAYPTIEHGDPDDHIDRGAGVGAEDRSIVARQDECGEAKSQ